jgi:phage terminase large subunit-like protein
MNRSLSINVELSSSVAGNLQFAVKSHGKNIEPKFTELVKYELTSGTLQIADIVSLIRAVTELNDQYDDVRILAVLPPAPSATFTFSRFLISLV